MCSTTLFDALPLQSLGLNRNQLETYIAVAELGQGTAAEIARKAGIARTTVYANLDTLSRIGLVSVDEGSTVRLFIANSPTNVKTHIESEFLRAKKTFKEKIKVADETANALQKYFNRSHCSPPRIQFVEGENAVRRLLFQNCALWQQSTASCDYTWWGYQDGLFVSQYRDWLEYYWTTLLEEERIKLLSNLSAREQVLERQVPKREIRPLSSVFEFTSTIWIIGNYIVSLSTRTTPHYGFQILDSQFAHNLRTIFQLHWACALLPE